MYQLRVGVFTSGGDAPGMNASVRAAVRTVLDSGCRCYAIYEGFNGMVRGGDLIKEMFWNDVGGIMDRGGTIIGTARSAEFRTPEGRREAAHNLIKRGINALVCCGGDGSLTGADLFRREWPDLLQQLCDEGKLTADEVKKAGPLRLSGFVGTIDNDMCGTHLTIGADTALTRVVDAIDMLASTAESHRRTFVVEAMGRNCGYLALLAGVLAGADFVFYPECPPCGPKDGPWETQLCAALEARRSLCKGRKMSIVVVSEGAIDCHGEPITALAIQKAIQTNLGHDTRITILGHTQRGGSPTVTDRYVATLMGAAAAVAVCEELPEGANFDPVLIGIEGNRVVRSPLMECVSLTRSSAQLVKGGRFDEVMALRCPAFQEAAEAYKRNTDYVVGIGKESAKLRIRHAATMAALRSSLDEIAEVPEPDNNKSHEQHGQDEGDTTKDKDGFVMPKPHGSGVGKHGGQSTLAVPARPGLKVTSGSGHMVEEQGITPTMSSASDNGRLGPYGRRGSGHEPTPLTVHRRSTAHAARFVSATDRASSSTAAYRSLLFDPASQDPASSVLSSRSMSLFSNGDADDQTEYQVATNLPTLAGLRIQHTGAVAPVSPAANLSPTGSPESIRSLAKSPLSTPGSGAEATSAHGDQPVPPRHAAPITMPLGVSTVQTARGAQSLALTSDWRQPGATMRVGVVLCGAPAPGMNAVLSYFVRSSVALGYEVCGFLDGMSGMAAGLCRPINWGDVETWTSLGGAVLGCNRSVAGESMQAPLSAIAHTLENERISALVMIGGFEGYRSMHALAQSQDRWPAFDIPLVCIPSTISSNLPVSECSVGCDRGLTNLVEAVDKIKQSAVSMQRLFIIECMGAYCGYLAFMGGLTCGAERTYLPEEALTLSDVANDVADMRSRFAPPNKRALQMEADRQLLVGHKIQQQLNVSSGAALSKRGMHSYNKHRDRSGSTGGSRSGGKTAHGRDRASSLSSSRDYADSVTSSTDGEEVICGDNDGNSSNFSTPLNQSIKLQRTVSTGRGPRAADIASRQWRQTAIVIKNERASHDLFSSPFLKTLFERESEGTYDVRVSVLGHLQQGGSPTITDRLRALRFANAAVGFLRQVCSDGVHRFSRAPAVMLGEVHGLIVFDDLHKFHGLVDFNFRRPINQWWLNLRSLNELLSQPWPGYSHSAH